MSDPNLLTQRQIQDLQDGHERLRKADTGASTGTSFPGAPQTNQLFFRTDLGWWCYYDGTRWLTVHETAHPLAISDAANPVTYSGAGNTITARSPYRGDYSLYVTRVATVTLVATTNNATNYWTYTLRAVVADGSSPTNVHTFNTSGDAAGAQSNHDAAPSVSPPVFASRNYFDIVVTKTLAPGALTFWSTVYYRMIVT